MEFKVVLEYDEEEQCWVSHVPSLDGVCTWGKTREEALSNTCEAITGYLEAIKKEGLPLPSPRPVEITEIVIAE